MSRQRRNWTPEEKAAIVLEILREESTLAEISKKYDIAQPVLSYKLILSQICQSYLTRKVKKLKK